METAKERIVYAFNKMGYDVLGIGFNPTSGYEIRYKAKDAPYVSADWFGMNQVDAVMRIAQMEECIYEDFTRTGLPDDFESAFDDEVEE